MGSTSTNIQSNGVESFLGSPPRLTVKVPTHFDGDVTFSGSVSTPTWVLVSAPEDLPTPSGGIIILGDNITYVITATIDLSGSRLVAGRNTTIIGGSSENCRVKSTGLVGTALLSSAYSLPLRNFTIEADIGLNLNATGTVGAALDWYGVKFTDCGSVGTIANYNNVTLSDCAFLNSGELTIDGTINTFAFSQCLLSIPSGKTGVTIASSATIASSFHIIHSSIIVPGTSTGIFVSNLASLPLVESFVLDTVSFSGGGTYLSGITQASAPAFITGCTGIDNSAAVVEYYMTNNATQTNLTLRNTFYKVQGITSAGLGGSQFLLSNNRATFIGPRAGLFMAQGVITLTDGNNMNIALRFAVNEITIVSSETFTNTGTGGRSQNVAIQGVVPLSSGSYVELWAANTTSADATMTVVDMNVIVNRLG